MCGGAYDTLRFCPVLRVYPRVCGGADGWARSWLPCSGLSPRVRGSRARYGRGSGGSGSIPACAGEPRPCAVARASLAVYPRVCGEPGLWPTEVPVERVYPRVCGGAVPKDGIEGGQKVYPRVCGGAVTPSFGSRCSTGLSPRVRGSLQAVGQDIAVDRSIPACAGSQTGGQGPDCHVRSIPACAGEPTSRT